MNKSLYRKEALENRNRSLYGEIILRVPPSTVWITLLLVLLTGLILTGLFLGKVTLDSETLTLFDWLKRSLSLG